MLLPHHKELVPFFFLFFLPPALKYHKSITAPYDRHVLLNDWGTVDPKGRLIFASFHCSGSHFVVEFVVNSKPKKKKKKIHLWGENLCSVLRFSLDCEPVQFQRSSCALHTWWQHLAGVSHLWFPFVPTIRRFLKSRHSKGPLLHCSCSSMGLQHVQYHFHWGGYV